ncbi:hypothetical protein JGUZn3_22370 [Entomobacter blattae]|uniref:Phage protein n=2 Tax=Entomobacter blattae TaxID=2762277 RepID=A0A7H1NUH8_9PROT|nr:hypothetical protein JGUZn3_22370 [Entomobacter blattae]
MKVNFSTLVLLPCLDAFGDDIMFISSQKLQKHTIKGIFDKAFYEQEVLADTALPIGNPQYISALRAVIGIRLADLPFAPQQNDRIIHKNITYVVNDVRLDGQGGAHLILNEVSQTL